MIYQKSSIKYSKYSKYRKLFIYFICIMININLYVVRFTKVDRDRTYSINYINKDKAEASFIEMSSKEDIVDCDMITLQTGCSIINRRKMPKK